MKNKLFTSLILTTGCFLLASTLAMLLPGSSQSWNAIAIAESQEGLANEESSEAENECNDDELVNCGLDN